MELLQLLHSRCTDLKAEIRAVMLKHGIKTMRLVPVKRNYAFENSSIPAREQWVLKVGKDIDFCGVLQRQVALICCSATLQTVMNTACCWTAVAALGAGVS